MVELKSLQKHRLAVVYGQQFGCFQLTMFMELGLEVAKSIFLKGAVKVRVLCQKLFEKLDVKKIEKSEGNNEFRTR